MLMDVNNLKALIVICYLIAALLGVFIADIVWYLVINPALNRLMRHKCKACFGFKGDWIDGEENIWCDCEVCNGKGYY